jgi:uncharacterized protein YjbI with pentapeptide repeats
MKQEELNKILEDHKLWLTGYGGIQANLKGANLQYADLQYAVLKDADLQCADLECADLQGANLQDADLQDANLKGANLRYADLKGADLQGADLKGSNLQGTNLQWANLRFTDLQGAILKGANLEGADLKDADLRYVSLQRANLKNAELQDVNLKGADLQDANLQDAKGCSMACPEEGSFIGFKKCYGKIVKLEILANSKRSSATNRKCRCDKARVLSITSFDELQEFKDATSDYDNTFIYKVGETVSVNDFDDNRWNECAGGIHFFITRQEAMRY